MCASPFCICFVCFFFDCLSLLFIVNLVCFFFNGSVGLLRRDGIIHWTDVRDGGVARQEEKREGLVDVAKEDVEKKRKMKMQKYKNKS